MSKTKCLVVLSGGQDSTTCLGWAKNRFAEVHTLTFDYGQRHKIELESAKKISDLSGAVSHRVITVSSLSELGGNALTGAENVSDKLNDKNLPNTFVPGRNLVFLTLASAWAYQLGVNDLVTGVCETDFSGYPDCRQNTMKALELAINLGMESNISIHTPLMWLSKAQTVKMARDEGCLDWIAHSHTCYEGQSPPCGKCPACVLRQKGFDEAGIPDPLISA